MSTASIRKDTIEVHASESFYMLHLPRKTLGTHSMEDRSVCRGGSRVKFWGGEGGGGGGGGGGLYHLKAVNRGG